VTSCQLKKRTKLQRFTVTKNEWGYILGLSLSNLARSLEIVCLFFFTPTSKRGDCLNFWIEVWNPSSWWKIRLILYSPQIQWPHCVSALRTISICEFASPRRRVKWWSEQGSKDLKCQKRAKPNRRLKNAFFIMKYSQTLLLNTKAKLNTFITFTLIFGFLTI
jgi:hypothetical protein